MVFQEADLSVRVVRDIFSEQFERAIVDDEKQHHRLESFFTAHGAGAARPRSSSTRTTSRCSSATASRTRSSRCCSAGSTCPRAAT